MTGPGLNAYRPKPEYHRHRKDVLPSIAPLYNDPLSHHRLSYLKGGGGSGKTTRTIELLRVRSTCLYPNPPRLLDQQPERPGHQVEESRPRPITVSSVGVGIMIGRPTAWTRGSSLACHHLG